MYLYNLNHLREIAKLPRFESVDKNSKLRVTNAKPWNSWHQYGRAIDIYPIEGGKIIWKSEHPLWHILFSAAEATGLERGPKWESAHFQHTEGLTFKNVMKA
jgi:peptidoglycan L-alanyl-D-glutamate endopeptidase CwlK